MEIWTIVLQVIQIVLFIVAGLLLRSYLPAYFSEKGKNLATKEDVQEITKKVESIRVQYAKRQHRHEKAIEREFNALSEIWILCLT